MPQIDRHLRRTSLVALCALFLTPVAAAAQEAESAEPSIAAAQLDEAHEQLLIAMEQGVDRELMLERATAMVAEQIIITLPAQMIEGKSNLHAELSVALLGPMRMYSKRVNAEFRPRLISTIAEVFTPEESAKLAEFYSSDLGRRALMAASNNLSVDAMAADGLDDMKVEAESVERDIAETGARAFGSMSTADRAEIMRISVSDPAFAKIPLLQQRIAPVRAEMESTPPLPEESVAIQQAMMSVFAR